MDKAQQYIRACKLIVFGLDRNGLDLSELRIKFSVKRSDVQTLNVADIRVYNVSAETASQMFNDYSPTINGVTQATRGRVLLQAGYEGNFGVIFEGNIKQIILGRESATDTFVDIVAADGDIAYNFAVLNTTLAKGSTQESQVTAAVATMAPKGVTAGHVGEMPTEALPRGKVMYGNARNYLRNVAQNTQKTWSIQDGKVTFVPVKSYLPGERVILTSNTGMIGAPQQTNEGVNVKCLLNPLIKVSGQIQIDNASVQRFKINLSVPNSAANIVADLVADGVYYVMVIEHNGDTRGVDWYTSLVCITMVLSGNAFNSVQVGFN